MEIQKIFIEYQEKPLGLDEERPRISWLLSSEQKNVLQTACQIQISEKGHIVWDSGKLETRESTGIEYAGPKLKACTRYEVIVFVWDNYGNAAEKQSWFETGFMNPSIQAWNGAKWIGAPRYTVCAQNRGVFIIETKFRMEKNAKHAGIVFGANDFRLLDRTKNEFGLEGENYIRFEINCSHKIPKLDIYRVGYAREDQAHVPFASVPLVNFEGEEKIPVITSENVEQFHTMQIEIDGNNARTYVDGVLVDAVREQMFFGEKISGRTLNPRGNNDVLTYPRLNEIGFFAGEGDTVYFEHLTVRNLRHPSNPFTKETPMGDLYGRSSIFDGKTAIKDGCFVVEGKQITADPSDTSIPMLRTEFALADNKKLEKARLYITARGIYDVQINGEKLTERLLTPGLTQYDHRINYQTYDITDKVKCGENGIGVTLASGWWSDAQTFTVRNYNYFGDKEALLARLVLTYEDGTNDSYVTNTDTWKYFGDGPYKYAGFFAGEHYDARKAEIYEQYSKAGFDAAGWEVPVEVTPVRIPEFRALPEGFGRTWPSVNETEPGLIGEYDAPVYVVDHRCAKKRIENQPGIYIYDLEQEMAGVPRITFHEKAGTKILIRYAEVLYPDLPEYEGKAGTMMLENYRDATSTDLYICSGKETEIYQPKFTFHGYRYIEISGVQNPPQLEEVESLQYSSITEFDGRFECNDALLNRFAENVRWSQKCNFINIPTDCPQRNERMGWAGDTHVFCHTALQNSNLKLFYERNLQAMSDLQTPQGQYPEIAPIGGGFGGITYECATIFIAWELYQQYGDIRILKKFYSGMKKYMIYMRDKGLPGEGKMEAVGPLGDWLAPEETDLQLLWNAFYYRENFLMAQIAELLEDKESAKEYVTMARKTKEYWNQHFVDPKTKKTKNNDGTLCDTQCSYVLGLEYDVMEDRTAAVTHLIRKTRELGHTVGTGFFGTGLLNRALTKLGYTEDAYELMLQTECPSWLYPVTQGATTIWEHWDSYTQENGFGGRNSMNSFNHYSLGSVLAWIYQVILGIRRDETAYGWTHFILKPEPARLDWAKGSVASPYGIIKAEWEKREDKIKYQCTIPVNTTADLCLPNGSVQKLGSGTHQFVFSL